MLEDYLKIGQRIKKIRHAFNLREKLNVVGFKVSERARGNPPMKQGPHAYSPNVLAWDDMKQEYYEAMGWDRETAVSLKNTIDDLYLP